MLNNPGSPVTTELGDECRSFLERHGYGGRAVVGAIAGGGNNRVYHVRDNSRDAVLKVYFQNPGDPRDRFGAERAFYTFAANQRIDCIPDPIGWDAEQKLGLISFVEGRKLSAMEIGEAEVRQAIEFVSKLNAARHEPDAAQIPVASEACFSIGEHLTCIDRRVARVEGIGEDSDLDRAAAEFVRDGLKPAWERIRSEIMQACRSEGNQVESQLSIGERCLSPSDFGFHNALLPENRPLKFFDFEYAGWDDPAKLICDFFCQPQVPVGLEFWDRFVTALEKEEVIGPAVRQRSERLFPAYRVKWGCILLNEFIPTERARREFAVGRATAIERKAARLERARLSVASADALRRDRAK